MYLLPQFTNQGNDTSMLPPMGRNTTAFGGANYLNFPFPNDPVKQAAAAALNSVTALTESTGGFTPLNDAYPLGYQTDVLKYDYSICVYVRNVYNRWVEIMVEADNHAICVSDWRKPDQNDNPPQTTCANSLLYTCRESGNAIQGNTFKDTMAIRFYCNGIGCESYDFAFKWRITARCVYFRDTYHDFSSIIFASNNFLSNIFCSNLVPSPQSGNTMSDSEYWCHMRNAFDYPKSLLKPYPASYTAPAVFQAFAYSSAATASPSLVALVLAGIALVVALLF